MWVHSCPKRCSTEPSKMTPNNTQHSPQRRSSLHLPTQGSPNLPPLCERNPAPSGPITQTLDETQTLDPCRTPVAEGAQNTPPRRRLPSSPAPPFTGPSHQNSSHLHLRERERETEGVEDSPDRPPRISEIFLDSLENASAVGLQNTQHTGAAMSD